MTTGKRYSTAAMLLATVAPLAQAVAAPAPKTPIQHVIIVVGENHTFDNLFGTYKPAKGQSIDNLLSRGIVNQDGTPGPNFASAAQNVGIDNDRSYHAVTASIGTYKTLPRPYTTYGLGLPQSVPDVRFPANLPNGPYQISKYVPYAAYTGDPVHRFFQMWQDVDQGRHDKFAWVEQTIGTGSNGAPPPAGGFNPMEGAISLGFYNMNPYKDAKGVANAGDAQIFKSFADTYALADNYHQGVMGGTGANFQMLATGDAAFFTNPDGTPGTPYANQIENPNPYPGTNNYYTQDGYGGGSYVNCSDQLRPGVGSVLHQLALQGAKPNCAKDTFYLVNNYTLYWKQDGSTNQLGSDKFVLPPQSNPTIGDDMTAHGLSWKYYSADRGSDVTQFAKSVDGIPLLFHAYCNICDPLSAYTSIETTAQANNLQNYGAFLADVKASTLPAVSFVRPFEALAGHPADSTTDLYEVFLQDLIKQVQANPSLWASTAILITTDEGGGYYDSGYIQAVDFFGDGTRIPFLAVSPFAKKGFVDHTYYDHVSLLKFIEANWGLPPISGRSRDNLPNPVHTSAGWNRYKPTNGASIGDLMNMFDFSKPRG